MTAGTDLAHDLQLPLLHLDISARLLDTRFIMSDTVSRLLSKVHLGGDSSKDAPSDAAGGKGASARKRNKTSVNDGEDCGDFVEDDSLAGGGKAYGHNRTNVRVSEAMRRVLAQEGEIPEDAAAAEKSEALDAILKRPQVIVPDWVNDRSHPISEYFISTSHNTYLSGRQLVGKSTSMTYTHALRIGCRCVEIDAWDNDDNLDEPEVTHGLTLSSKIPFRDVCKAISDQVDVEIAEAKAAGTPLPLPVFISLENHCKERGQAGMHDIMLSVFGDKLVTQSIDTETEPTVKDLEGKITVMVEFYGVDLNADDTDSSSDSSSDEEERAMKKKKQATKPAKIIPALASLGIYAQSIKPKDISWLRGELREPQNHMINVSEGTVHKLLEKHDAKAMIAHNAHHLIRVYPAGLRIDSTNLHPCPFWAVGAQVAALNTQTFDASMQINEAFFAGTAGYALKPAPLRRDPPVQMPKGSVRVKLHIAGVSDLLVQPGREDDVRPYVTCTLHHGLSHRSKPEKRKTDVYKQHHHHPHLVHRHPEMPPPTQPVWHETLEWTFDKAFFDLAVIRILIKSDDRWKENPVLCVAAMRTLFAPKEWSFIRLLDLKGHETQSTLLAKFEIEDI
ncbi:hypothetical protein CF336_g6818 [Tilletia laevis]|uniref:Phosphoinositide phospholipase C n=3 Tax=Tilletia TaxID=13289 RepID=A0A177V9Z9_9BASI|nr:hypothetical protein CF336_g6818 [Tilletia laevis]KAE8253454.1 hypothetical protein A4X03_0g5893 [Tilletia caries]